MAKRCCGRCSAYVISFSIAILGIILILLGAAFKPLFRKLYNDELKARSVMKRGSENFNNWARIPIPLYMKYYVFNYTNVEEILDGGVPKVKQIGPYVYREYRWNQILKESPEEITYLQNYSFVFVQEQSCQQCSQDDLISTPNSAFWTLVDLLKKAHVTSDSSFLKILAMEGTNILLYTKNVMPFHKLTIHQLIWGYEDKFLRYIVDNPALIDGAMKILNLTLPNINPKVILQHNTSSEAHYIGNVTLKTGKENIDDLQTIFKWRGLSTSPYWMNKYGNMINGTDGTHFKPFLDPRFDSKLYVFITDVCRSLYLRYTSPQVISNIPLLRYELTEDVLANASVNPDNIAFCVGGCWRSGLLPVGQCLKGNPPIFISNPHFFQSDPSLAADIKGMRPNKTLHETFADIDPVTGLTMNVHKRLQINILAERIQYINAVKHFKEQTVLPILYVDETSTISDKYITKYKQDVLLPKEILKWFRFGLYILGSVLTIVTTTAFIFLTKRKRR